MKRALLFCLTLCLVFAVGCGDKHVATLSSQPSPASTVSQPENNLLPNPLTGVKELTDGELNKRPIAIMINNTTVAQPVQSGLNDADMVFECYVEGGVTRLMAVFYDVTDVGRIGTIRSARNTFVYLAQGLGAVYAHHGVDRTYTQPYMRQIGLDDYNVGYVSGDSSREKNGLATEHTLITNGNDLLMGMNKEEYRLTNEEATPAALTFGSEIVTPSTPCTQVDYEMSYSYKTSFIYDRSTGKYTRNIGGEVQTDYASGEQVGFNNVFILYANTYYYSDNYHVYTQFTSGTGLYVSAGGCQEITWEKGDATNPLVLKTADGQPLTVNPGTSYFAFPYTSNQNKTVVK